MLKHGFPPIYHQSAKILILGSMPGEASLQQQQYYAHPRNAFWFIMQNVFDIPENTTYEEKCDALKQNQIAVWDVMQACERQGSLDVAIKNDSIQTNDFAWLFSECPNIERILFNGAKAEQEYIKRVLPMLPEAFQLHQRIRMPSTSPAMASLSKEQKLAAWFQYL